ncbi:MAG: hypothetical protein J6A58_12315, partial [Oscillospiraceae bacterium]|nr:hypothetical protein [Oscillospiraceae bacterium]
ILVILQSKTLKYLPKYYNIFIEKSQANYVFSLLDLKKIFLQVANSGKYPIKSLLIATPILFCYFT